MKILKKPQIDAIIESDPTELSALSKTLILHEDDKEEYLILSNGFCILALVNSNNKNGS